MGYFNQLQVLKEEPPAKVELFKINENVAVVPGKKEPNVAVKKVEQVRERSGTWGAATGTKQKEPSKKTPVKKEKEVRRASDERRQKRGE